MDTQLKNYYLQQLGIIPWQEKSKVAPAHDPNARWAQLQQRVANCTACALHKTRRQVVFGCGQLKPDLMIIGEAPGATEDRQGQPFVGRAGQLLNEMLHAIGLQREQVFIANVLKCRPPQNRDPSAEEVATCTPFLEQQVNFLQPKLLLAVGRVAAHYLLGVTTPLNQLRHQTFPFGEQHTPLMITYHPAYLLRNPRDKRKAFADLCLVQKKLAAL